MAPGTVKRTLTNEMKTKKKTNDLQIFPPIDVNGWSKINDDLKTRSCRDESQH